MSLLISPFILRVICCARVSVLTTQCTVHFLEMQVLLGRNCLHFTDHWTRKKVELRRRRSLLGWLVLCFYGGPLKAAKLLPL